MKKRISSVVLTLLLLFSVVSAVFAAEFPVEFRWDQPIYPNVKADYVMKIGYLDHPNPWDSDEHAMAVVMKNLIERGTKGKIRVDLFPSGQLGKEATMTSMLIEGKAMQAGLFSEGIIPTFYKSIQVLSIPYVFKNEAIAYHVLDGWFGAELSEDMVQKSGVRILGYSENGGFRHFSNSVRPIHSPEDMKGLKMRTMEHAGHMAIVTSLGAIATPIPWADLYTSLKTKVVAGQENSVPLINQGKFYEVQDYLVLDGHVYSIDFILVNEKWDRSLPKEYQQIVKLASYQAALTGRGISRTVDWEKMAYFENSKKFKEIYLPSAEEKEAFAKVTQPAYLEWYRKEVDPAGTWSDKLFKAVAEAETYFGK